ncbi:hypothetical protein KNE206_14300 [Kitasatospora sp. NE20-6]|uniref:hypothetical protein n=1 Tax=Kitasatospora sp. NE20-6 TaxID=2859066 RepID=UPI0034DC193A
MAYDQTARQAYGAAGHGGGLVAIGVLMLVQLALDLGLLVSDLATGRYDAVFRLAHRNADLDLLAMAGFFTPVAVVCAALLTLAVSAFNGARWVRPAAVALLPVIACSGAGTQLFTTLSTGTDVLSLPVRDLVAVLEPAVAVVLAGVVVAVVAATRRPVSPAHSPLPAPGGSPADGPYRAP